MITKGTPTSGNLPLSPSTNGSFLQGGAPKMDGFRMDNPFKMEEALSILLVTGIKSYFSTAI